MIRFVLTNVQTSPDLVFPECHRQVARQGGRGSEPETTGWFLNVLHLDYFSVYAELVCCGGDLLPAH